MKKVLSVILSLCLLMTLLPVSIMAQDDYYIELDSLLYEEYMRGETLFISGSTNTYVTLGLYYPIEAGGTLKYSMVYSPDELAEGIELEIGESSDWLYGEWTIVVQCGEVSETLYFTLSEIVDRTQDDDDESDDSSGPEDPGDDGAQRPDKKPIGGGNTPTVVSIVPDKTKITLEVDSSATVNITTAISSLQVEIADDHIVAASISGKKLTVTGLKTGSSSIWVKGGNNYATVNVTVVPKTQVEKPEVQKPQVDPIPPVEKPTEPEKKPLPFTDVENHWAKESITKLYNMGIVNGMDEDTFAPDANVTRAQFVTMLQKAFALKSEVTISPFTDVNSTDWYFSPVMAAYENGIANGYGGMFNPNSLVTRQDMAVFAHRAALSSGKTFSLSNLTTFTDHTSISDYAVEAVYSMKSVSVINGMTESTFEPLGNATRAQAAHIIAKLLDL